MLLFDLNCYDKLKIIVMIDIFILKDIIIYYFVSFRERVFGMFERKWLSIYNFLKILYYLM